MCHGAVYVFRVFLRGEGVVLGELATVLAISGIQGMVRESQAVGDVRHGRVLGDTEFRFPRVFLRANEFRLRYAGHPSFAVGDVDEEVQGIGLIGVRSGPLAVLSVFGHLFSGEGNLRARGIRLSRSDVFGG